MPTYEYRCNACQREFEYQQKMADPDLVKCEACGEDKLEKLISWTSFQLKGGGWYKDLYASNPKEALKDSVDKGKPPKAEPKAAEASTPAPSTPAPSSSDSGSTGSSGGTSGGTGGSSTASASSAS